jgi:DNA invertase Pin-like site-specific DNA recombinase
MVKKSRSKSRQKAAKETTGINRFVGYIRVSTQQQGRSGLGLEAQRAAIYDYVVRVGGEMRDVFVEIESGKQDSRPELNRAIDRAVITGSTLLIAKLDRLSRKARFIFEMLAHSGVKFVCVDNPNADKVNIQFLAIIAEMEGDQISSRTKAALQAAKARGIKLGRPDRPKELWAPLAKTVHPTLLKAKMDSIRPFFPDRTEEELTSITGSQLGAAMGNRTQGNRRRAFRERIRPTVELLGAQGITSTKAIAERLNADGCRTQRGCRWHPNAVARLIKHLTERKPT